MNNEKVYSMPFDKVYRALVNKAVKKMRTQEEVNQIIGWLTGYATEDIAKASENETTYGDFFRNAPAMNPARILITGSVCGVKLAEIEDPLMKEIRYLDKMVDELAKGKPIEKILRKDV